MAGNIDTSAEAVERLCKHVSNFSSYVAEGIRDYEEQVGDMSWNAEFEYKRELAASAWQAAATLRALAAARDRLAAERGELRAMVLKLDQDCKDAAAANAALAAALAQARREGMEEAVKVAAEYGHTDDGDVFRIVEMIVKAIRAKAQEVKS
jgi:hypothetical protein